MILRQFLHSEADRISYLLACCESRLAIVVDAVGDIQKYLGAADEAGARVGFVIDTHLYADHLSSGRKMLQRVGAEYLLSARAQALFPHRAVREGEVIALGAFNVTVLETPGLGTENIALLIAQEGATTPSYILTGHALVYDPGCPLPPTVLKERARALFKSIQKLKRLPDLLEVLPGNLATCSRAHSLPCSTIGYERSRNKAMRIEDEGEFVEFVLSGGRTAPVGPVSSTALHIKKAPEGNLQ